MWPHARSDSQPLLTRQYPSVTALYCSFAPNENLGLSSGKKQLRWWHSLNKTLELVLERFGAVAAERDESGHLLRIRRGRAGAGV